ncbi:MAG: GNAT family N-acetyltransferase [Veillonellaceae bacterium]|nr:GNAT family N-acetyltransferase [Veillonellaceae bacterium]
MADNWVLFDEGAGKEYDVTVCTDEAAWSRIEPNMIYNRLDLIREESSELLQVAGKGEMLYVPCCIIDNTAILGVWGMRLTMAQVQAVARYIFEHSPEVVAVSSRRADLVDAPETFHKVNDFHIDLPSQPSDFDQRISSKMRYNLRREQRLAESKHGTIFVGETNVKDTEAEELFKRYFTMKKVTHGRDYGMTMVEYIRQYYVSMIYTLRFGKHLVAIVFSCEQGNSVYLENLTYDVAFSKFSPGSLLYNQYLKRLALKKKRALYIKGGALAYKRHYGSIEQWLSTFKIYRNADVVGQDTF